MANTRSPLLTGVTDKILTREKNIIPTSYAVGKTFTGAQLDNSIHLDTFIKPGIWRISNNITQNPDNKLPIDNIEGFLQVLEINHDEDRSGLRKAARIRQIVFPDHLKESSPYTRVGQAVVAGGDITWSEWGMMGGGNLRRVIMTRDTTAKNNVLYESFGPYTLTLPNPEKVPVGTQIGLEQYFDTGYVVCGDLKQVTESSVEYPEDYSDTPMNVGLWTQDPYGVVGERHTVFNIPIVMTESSNIEVHNSDPNDLPDNTNLSIIVGTYSQLGSVTTDKNSIHKGTVFKKDGADVYLYYDIHRDNWLFANSYTTLQNTVYFEGEYNLQVKDSTIYIFECSLNEDGTRTWELDVDHNYARAVNTLSTRIHDVDVRVEHVKACHLPTYGRKHIYHSTYLNIAADRKYNVTDNELEQDEELFKAAVAATNDVRFYDHTVVIPKTDTRTVAYLPDATLSPIGTRITFELVVDSGKTRECTIYDKRNGADNNSQKFAVAGEGGVQTLTIPFQCEKRGSGANEWVFLTTGGNTAIPKEITRSGDTILEDQPVGSFRWWFGKLSVVPDGWLVCDGSAFDSSSYPELYSTLGTNSLPDLIGRFIKGSSSTPLVPEEAGLPNITGDIDLNGVKYSGSSATGVFEATDAGGNGGCHELGTRRASINFNASRSSSVYGKSDTVTPANVSAIPIIKAKPTLYSASKMSSHIGMIFASPAAVDCGPEGAYPLDGRSITCSLKSENTHPEFYDYVVNKLPDKAKIPIGSTNDKASATGTTWYARNKYYGFCGKFGTRKYKGSDGYDWMEVKLPYLLGAYITGAPASLISTEYRDGLPDIVGIFPGSEGYYIDGSDVKYETKGAFKKYETNVVTGVSENNKRDLDTYLFQASLGTVKYDESTGVSQAFFNEALVDGKRKTKDTVTFMGSSSSPYGKSSVVRPRTVQYRWYIQVDPMIVKVDTSLLRDLQSQINELKTIVKQLQDK